MYSKKFNVKKIEKTSTKKWATKLLNYLISSYGVGSCNFDVLKMIGHYDEEKKFIFKGDTQDVIIYDALSNDENDDLDCRTSHYFIESDGIIYLEIYIWWDTHGKVHVFDIKEIHSTLTRHFKLIAFQIINGNYNEK